MKIRDGMRENMHKPKKVLVEKRLGIDGEYQPLLLYVSVAMC